MQALNQEPYLLQALLSAGARTLQLTTDSEPIREQMPTYTKMLLVPQSGGVPQMSSIATARAVAAYVRKPAARANGVG